MTRRFISITAMTFFFNDKFVRLVFNEQALYLIVIFSSIGYDLPQIVISMKDYACAYSTIHMIIQYICISVVKIIIKYFLSNFRLDFLINNIICYILINKPFSSILDLFIQTKWRFWWKTPRPILACFPLRLVINSTSCCAEISTMPDGGC